MNDFGSEHRNVGVIGSNGEPVMTPLSPMIRDFSGTADMNAAAFQAAVNGLMDGGATGVGGYLYFPPGRYLIGRSSFLPNSGIPIQEFGDVVVPPNVTLWFAPEAVLVPMAFPAGSTRLRDLEGFTVAERRSVRIEIHGDIIADRQKIFESAPDLAIGLSEVGFILLAGNRIREVYPEWWGASPEKVAGFARVNRLAVQAAVDAAYHRRVTPKRYRYPVPGFLHRRGDIMRDNQGAPLWHRRPPIPVVLMGQYRIDAAIVIETPPGLPSDPSHPSDPLHQPPLGGFELVGDHGQGTTGSGVPSLKAASPFSGDTLLTIRGPLGFSMTNVTFDGNDETIGGVPYLAAKGVDITVIDGDWGCSTFEGCSFLRAFTLLAIDAETQRRTRRLDAADTDPVRSDFLNMLFTRCRFETGTYVDVQTMINSYPFVDRENNFICVELRLGDNQGVEFRSCWFTGPASPSIRAFSGRFALNESLSHHTRPFQIHGYVDLPDFSHGSDVIIETPPDTSALRGAGFMPIVPAAFTAREHRSHSWQLFATKRIFTLSFPQEVRRSAYILLNVKAWIELQAEPGISAGELDPPVVFWGDPGVMGCPLIMAGCQFHGQPVTLPGRTLDAVELHQLRGVVVVLDGSSGPIFNIGTDLSAVSHGTRGATEAVRLMGRPRLPGDDASLPTNVFQLVAGAVDGAVR